MSEEREMKRWLKAHGFKSYDEAIRHMDELSRALGLDKDYPTPDPLELPKNPEADRALAEVISNIPEFSEDEVSHETLAGEIRASVYQGETSHG